MKAPSQTSILWALGGAAAMLAFSHIDFPPAANAQQSAASTTTARFPDAPPVSPTITLTPEELANIRVYEVANKSVVNIDTETEQIAVDPFFMRRSRIPGQGSGSGSVLDKRGHILTNAHVIENAKKIEVTLASGQSYIAELVGQDREHDIAVLRINAPRDELTPLSLGKSDGLRVGQQAYTLGNPFGLEGTLTKGIISSLNRSIEGRTGREMKSLIQTDAAMNPGNSGGPLLDTSAQMIGMNVAIATKTGQNTGVGFAIPASRIRKIVPQLIKYGKIFRPDHGIVELRASDRGIKIERLRPDGPAERAGLQAIVKDELRQQGSTIYRTRSSNFSRGDWLTAVDDKPIQTPSDFLEVMDGYKPGDTVTLTIIREGKEQKLSMTLGEA